MARTPNTSLWQSAGTPRLVSLTEGRYFDGWFGPAATVTVWPRPEGSRIGTLCLRLSLPGTASTTLDLTAPGTRRTVHIAGGAPLEIALPAVVRERWILSLKARIPLATADGRTVSVFGEIPRFVTGKASATTCR